MHRMWHCVEGYANCKAHMKHELYGKEDSEDDEVNDQECTSDGRGRSCKEIHVDIPI
jgi:hypothetical protein